MILMPRSSNHYSCMHRHTGKGTMQLMYTLSSLDMAVHIYNHIYLDHNMSDNQLHLKEKKLYN